jgi:U3 small nucleolar RNA-associated protein 19
MIMLHKPPKSSRLKGNTGDAAGGNVPNGSSAEDVLKDSPAAGGTTGGGCEDVYVESEEDPAYSRAVESSLWEVEAFRHHHSPQVCGAKAGMCAAMVPK